MNLKIFSSIFIFLLIVDKFVESSIKCDEDDVECHEKAKYSKGFNF
jgi:hypothetical protein